MATMGNRKRKNEESPLSSITTNVVDFGMIFFIYLFLLFVATSFGVSDFEYFPNLFTHFFQKKKKKIIHKFRPFHKEVLT